MKKLVLVLAVLLISLPAMAATVTVTATCQNDVWEVTYATDGNLPRAFALDITVPAGTITAVSDLSTAYNIYPGSIVIVDGEVNDPGSAVCDASYPDTLGGLGTAGITIEMGSLYATGETAPAASGTLCKFTVSDTAATVTIAENGIRGGVVMEDPDEDAIVTFDVGTCGGCSTCLGDLTGDSQIDLNDLTEMMNVLAAAGAPYIVPVTVGNECADMVGNDAQIDLNDLTEMMNVLSAAGAPYIVPCP